MTRMVQKLEPGHFKAGIEKLSIITVSLWVLNCLEDQIFGGRLT